MGRIPLNHAPTFEKIEGGPPRPGWVVPTKNSYHFHKNFWLEGGRHERNT
jgi:hypothetical protein